MTTFKVAKLGQAEIFFFFLLIITILWLVNRLAYYYSKKLCETEQAGGLL